MVVFDVSRMAINNFPISYLGEVAVRSIISFFFVLTFIKLIGRRGIKQMTPLELVIVLSLGSAAGDVALYDDTPLLPVLVVFVVVILLYKMFAYALKKSDYFQEKFDGKPLLIIEDGVLKWHSLQKQSFSMDEVMMELRQKSIEQLGQIKLAFLEIDGNISVFEHEKKDIKPGLTTLPLYLLAIKEEIDDKGYYSCCHCSHTQYHEAQNQPGSNKEKCPRCGKTRWVKSGFQPME
ncbi:MULTISPECIES: DUF421 domain-containing protein [unclassified Brenneria]|uniref:DUF421 domain-containing protein n=1 Tax=unclassified Brenneria TaxID=2634434 RepID=UPI001551A787|nr:MULTISPECIES: YetF domain-containing protein [unclassified Brenneria]MBJ7222659.1 DUF421 domain-containing protein [Brenneria sp. L3-3C-1]MEE3643902.1 YetF domain-containing protein [Brenneria sp. L3_3C_1]MEE3651145.1 YetF domain-containing protein [Brenneria sp. HEZEL_4_2_4]NPD01100.1 DUF421 domain-containing protein [Brenneria sp. hezel4-2-4]